MCLNGEGDCIRKPLYSKGMFAGDIWSYGCLISMLDLRIVLSWVGPGKW